MATNRLLAAAVLLPQGILSQHTALEVRDAPYQIVDRLEGEYTRWGARWIGGPVYRRNEGSFKMNSNVPVFLGPICSYTFGGAPSTWCFAQCEEEHVMNSPALLLPCGVPAPDGTACPDEPKQPDTPAAGGGQERPVFCAVLGHARRWHEAGRAAGLEPPPKEFWRFNVGLDEPDWRDASGAAPGFAVSGLLAPSSAAPGERLRLRADGTLRPFARAELCLGAERGLLQEGTRLILWDCERPAHRHELFGKLTIGADAGQALQLLAEPGLCAVESATGALVLGNCQASAHLVAVSEQGDGTLRMGAAQELCLRSGLDRPELGSPLWVGRCSLGAPTATAIPQPERDSLVQEMRELQRSLESKLDLQVGRLSSELAGLRGQRAGAAEETDDNDTSCPAEGCDA